MLLLMRLRARVTTCPSRPAAPSCAASRRLLSARRLQCAPHAASAATSCSLPKCVSSRQRCCKRHNAEGRHASRQAVRQRVRGAERRVPEVYVCSTWPRWLLARLRASDACYAPQASRATTRTRAHARPSSRRTKRARRPSTTLRERRASPLTAHSAKAPHGRAHDAERVCLRHTSSEGGQRQRRGDAAAACWRVADRRRGAWRRARDDAGVKTAAACAAVPSAPLRRSARRALLACGCLLWRGRGKAGRRRAPLLRLACMSLLSRVDTSAARARLRGSTRCETAHDTRTCCLRAVACAASPLAATAVLSFVAFAAPVVGLASSQFATPLSVAHTAR